MLSLILRASGAPITSPFLSLLTPSPTPRPTDPLPGESGGGWDITWKWFLAVAAIVGFLAACQQLASWLGRRKLDRAELRLLEIAASQLDAEDYRRNAAEAREDADQLRRAKQSLLEEVRERIPLEARRVYLENRLSQLSASIQQSLTEYNAARLEILEIGQTADPLSKELRLSVQSIVDRDLRQRRRLEASILTLLGVLVVLFILPINAAALVYETFATLYFADRQGTMAVAGVMILLLLPWTGFLLAVSGVRGKWNPARWTKARAHARLVTTLSCLLAALGLAFAIWMIALTRETLHDFSVAQYDPYPSSLVEKTRFLAESGLILAVVFLGVALASFWLRRKGNFGRA